MKQLLLLVALLILVGIVPAKSEGYAGYNGCAEQDSLALVAFYKATGGANWLSNTKADFGLGDLSDFVLDYYRELHPHAGMGKWLEGPVKDWYGVRLEKQQIGASNDSIWRVVDLLPVVGRREAGNNNLQGYIPKEVGLLTSLRYFRVNGNSGLAGSELPDELYHPTLEMFDIEACQLEGVISDEMRKCTKIKYFNARTNRLTDVPLMDFLTHEHLLEHFGRGKNIIFYYTNRIPYSKIEKNVDYFLSNGLNQGDIQYEARQQNNMGPEREIIVSQGQDITVTTDVGGRDAEYRWFRNQFDTYVTGTSFTIKNIQQEVSLTARIKNEYIQFNDLNTGGYENVNTNKINVRFQPIAPVVNKVNMSYSGSSLEMVFSKPMASPSSSQAGSFVVMADGKSVVGVDIKRSGRDNEVLVLTLKSPIPPDVPVALSYSDGSVVCANGGELEAFSDLPVTNLVRPAPELLRAVTRTDGSGIFLEFDGYIDASTIDKSDFSVNTDYDVEISTIVMLPGRIAGSISKTIELVLGTNLPPNDDNISVSYTRGELTGLYSGTIQSVAGFGVQNVVEDNLATLTLTVNDGPGKFSNLYVGGSLSALAFPLSKEGNHLWTATVTLPNGEYNWNVYERILTTTYDTTSIVNDGITYITITPRTEHEDILVSEGINMVFNVLDKAHTGTTTFNYKIYQLTFIVDMSYYAALYPDEALNPYLMGLNNDWTVGIEMEAHPDAANRFIVKVPNFDIGDQFTFNFRNDDYWENQTPAMRSHTVAGHDIIRVGFGDGITKIETSKLSPDLVVYPNPATSHIYIKCSNSQEIKNLKIYNIHGHLIRSIEAPFNQAIDVSGLPNGVYILCVNGFQGEAHLSRFIKL
jgi:hypothetical protein